MPCKCAHINGEGRYNCDVSGDGCMFLIPDSVTCAVIYGEGPDTDNLDKIDMHCDSCHTNFKAKELLSNKKCPKCGSKNINIGKYLSTERNDKLNYEQCKSCDWHGSCICETCEIFKYDNNGNNCCNKNIKENGKWQHCGLREAVEMNEYE